jgi:hypothetical protein
MKKTKANAKVESATRRILLNIVMEVSNSKYMMLVDMLLILSIGSKRE